jgi:hypothetical protein
MPAPQGKMLAQLAKTLFTAKGINLPISWADLGIQFPDAFDVSELAVAPNPPTNLFKEATLNKYNVDTAGDIGKKFEKYIDGICDAICGAIDKWMKMAKFSSIQVAAVCAVGAPGCLTGPDIKSFIELAAPMKTKQEKKYSKAIAKAFSEAWKSWQDKLTVTGLPWYPAFAAFPGPQTPPAPNVPMPLITLLSAGEVDLAPMKLKKSMEDNLGDKDALHAPELFDAIANAFAAIFLTFKMTTMVMNVMGKGPVPSFAPPYAPVGPVAGGDVLPTPGILT